MTLEVLTDGSAGLPISLIPAAHRWDRYWGGPAQSPGSGTRWWLSWSTRQPLTEQCWWLFSQLEVFVEWFALYIYTIIYSPVLDLDRYKTFHKIYYNVYMTSYFQSEHLGVLDKWKFSMKRTTISYQEEDLRIGVWLKKTNRQRHLLSPIRRKCGEPSF